MRELVIHEDTYSLCLTWMCQSNVSIMSNQIKFTRFRNNFTSNSICGNSMNKPKDFTLKKLYDFFLAGFMDRALS